MEVSEVQGTKLNICNFNSLNESLEIFVESLEKLFV